jgi:hypothetical protein
MTLNDAILVLQNYLEASSFSSASSREIQEVIEVLFQDATSLSSLRPKSVATQNVYNENIGSNMAIGGVEVLAGALCLILPFAVTQAVGVALVGDGFRRAFDGVHEMNHVNGLGDNPENRRFLSKALVQPKSPASKRKGTASKSHGKTKNRSLFLPLGVLRR